MGVTGRQHPGDETDSVEERRPRHVVSLTMKIGRQVERQLVTQLTGSVQQDTWTTDMYPTSRYIYCQVAAATRGPPG